MGLSSYVAAASSSVSVQVCDAATTLAVISPADGTSTNNQSIVVSGYGPGNTAIAIYRNDSQMGTVTSGGDGSYSITTPLVNGSNLLYSRTTNTCDYTTQSNSITVYRQPKKAPQTTAPTHQNVSLTDATQPAPSTVTKTVQQPTIFEPKDGTETTSPTVFVRGAAEPGSRVSLLRNEQKVAEIMVDEEGQYAVSISLFTGQNTLQASVLSDQSEIKSSPIRIRYTPTVATTVARTSPSQWKIRLMWSALLIIILLVIIIIFLIRRHRQLAATHSMPNSSPYGHA